jgi:hypothetical protein
MRIPGMVDGLAGRESAEWSVEARRVLPSRSPRGAGAAVWAPVLGWTVLTVLAEWIERPEGAAPLESAPRETVAARAVKLFDDLRLRNAMGEAFGHLGLEGEEAWRAAARIRIAFLPEAEGGKSVARDASSGWWSDPDVRWLTGLHETPEGWYFNQESYEQTLWWAALPELVKVKTEPAVEKKRLGTLAEGIETELAAAKAAGYRLSLKPVAAEAPTTGDAEDMAIGEGEKALDPSIPIEEGEVVILATVPASSKNE